MSRSSTFIILGALVLLVPYSGLPVAVRGILEVAFGALVLASGIWMRSREMKRATVVPAASAPEPEEPTRPSSLPEEIPAHPPHGVSPI